MPCAALLLPQHLFSGWGQAPPSTGADAGMSTSTLQVYGTDRHTPPSHLHHQKLPRPDSLQNTPPSLPAPRRAAPHAMPCPHRGRARACSASTGPCTLASIVPSIGAACLIATTACSSPRPVPSPPPPPPVVSKSSKSVISVCPPAHTRTARHPGSKHASKQQKQQPAAPGPHAPRRASAAYATADISVIGTAAVTVLHVMVRDE